MDDYKAAGKTVWSWATNPCPCCRTGTIKDAKKQARRKGRIHSKRVVVDAIEEMARPWWYPQIDPWLEDGPSLSEMLEYDPKYTTGASAKASHNSGGFFLARD